MTDDRIRVLLAADDDAMIADLTGAMVRELDADVTVAGTLYEAQGLIAEDGFDAVVTARSLPDGCGLDLTTTSTGTATPPVILLDDALDAEQILAAIRAGARDVLTPPFDARQISRTIRRAATDHRRRTREQRRSRRLRRLSARILRDRRELRQRVDLICRDLVQAYRRLAEKVVEDSSMHAES